MEIKLGKMEIQERLLELLKTDEAKALANVGIAGISVKYPIAAVFLTAAHEIAGLADKMRFIAVAKGLSTELNQEEQINILNAILTAIPLRHRIIVSGPGSRCHIQQRVVLLVGYSIIRCDVCLRSRNVRKTTISVNQQTVRILRLLGHVFCLTVVLIGRVEHVIARAEQSRA